MSDTTDRDLDKTEAHLYPVREREWSPAADALRRTPARAPTQETAYAMADAAARDVLPNIVGAHADERIARHAEALRSMRPIACRESAAEARTAIGKIKSTIKRRLGFRVGEIADAKAYTERRPEWLSCPMSRAVWCASTAIMLAMLDSDEDASAHEMIVASMQYSDKVRQLAMSN